MHNERVLLLGSGPMAVDYWKVLDGLSVPVLTVGRGEASAQKFLETTGDPCMAGGLDALVASGKPIPDTAIVAVTVEQLAPTAHRLLDLGVRTMLVEKPGALTERELEALGIAARAAGASIFIAYNRRFYASTRKARELIASDGIQSLAFEFTEWSHVIRTVPKDPRVKAAWLIANSSHVIDMAFYLGGVPVDMHSLTAGQLNWHPASAVFVGAGRTELGALFSYQANWTSAGRWGVELMLPTQRLLLRPLEGLQSISVGKVVAEDVAIDDEWDKRFKPGLYRQTEAFLSGATGELCTLDQQLAQWSIYRRIAGYGDD